VGCGMPRRSAQYIVASSPALANASAAGSVLHEKAGQVPASSPVIVTSSSATNESGSPQLKSNSRVSVDPRDTNGNS